MKKLQAHLYWVPQCRSFQSNGGLTLGLKIYSLTALLMLNGCQMLSHPMFQNPVAQCFPARDLKTDRKC